MSQTAHLLIELMSHRDIVEGLRTCGCASTTHFEWQRQLRFELDPALDDVVIRQVQSFSLTIWVSRAA